jgi:hypothetical protein
MSEFGQTASAAFRVDRAVLGRARRIAVGTCAKIYDRNRKRPQ